MVRDEIKESHSLVIGGSMWRTLKTSQFCPLLAACLGVVFLHADDEPRYLLPPGQTAPAAQRSTYESLTEPRGSPKLRKDLKERKAQEERAKAAEEQLKNQQVETAEEAPARPEQPERCQQ